MRSIAPVPSTGSNKAALWTWVPQVSMLKPGIWRTLIGIFALPVACSLPVSAQTAAQAWLKYQPTGKPLGVPTQVNTLGQSPLQQTAAIELRRGLLSLSGKPLEMGPNMILLGTAQQMSMHNPKSANLSLEPDEFVISAMPRRPRPRDRCRRRQRPRCALRRLCAAAQPRAGH